MLFSQSRLLLHEAEGYDKSRFVIGWTPVLQLIPNFYVTPTRISSFDGELLAQLKGVGWEGVCIPHLNECGLDR